MRCLMCAVSLLIAYSGTFTLNAGSKKELKQASVTVETIGGHTVPMGVSGFNVRIADKIWSYNHPDFRDAVHGIRPGWLRYFSGTMGSAFNCATGQYDYDYTMMMDHKEQYDAGYAFTEVKGPHRITDLYELLGEVGGKLVVTINGFTEKPEITAELARFCKNNHIEVEVWQFCNEPYFYVPHRDRYFWNDGYDYARKMKPHADEILKVFPDAKLALNFTWDGIWGFMSEIYDYQQKEGRYWNVFSKHSYAPHVGTDEPFDTAYRRANSRLIEVTSPAAMREIEGASWQGAPLLITEFGVWNRPLNGIYSAIYNAEYTLRQLQHSNAFLIGSHEISNKFRPKKNHNRKIWKAYNTGKHIDTEKMRTGIEKDDEGKALEILHEATNNSDFVYRTSISGGAMVAGLKGERVEGTYAMAFRGVNGYDYLAVTNRSEFEHKLKIEIDGQGLQGSVERFYIYSKKAQNRDVKMYNDEISVNTLSVQPFSVTLLKWKNNRDDVPAQTRIYKTRITETGIQLAWWRRESATKYIVSYGVTTECKDGAVEVISSDNASVLIDNLKNGESYYFTVAAVNNAGSSLPSSVVQLMYSIPGKPQIFRVAPRDSAVTVYWNSVPDATGYRLIFENKNSGHQEIIDAKNVFGYRHEGLPYDVPYNVSVSAYNGLGDGVSSGSVSFECKRNLPIPPRNVSATETENGNVLVRWVNQDSVHADVSYSVLRGTRLHDFKSIATNIQTDSFIDHDAHADSLWFYTVMARTNAGETNYYPNIATLIKHTKQVVITVNSIRRRENAFVINVSFKNIPLDGDIRYGIALSDISYLNIDEEQLFASDVSETGFTVRIPFKKLKKGREYALKAFVETNGAPIYSLPPHKTIKY
jgi:hypothetical protein